MFFSQVLQNKDTWHFDITSAIIGAAIAWLIVGIVYNKRREILAFVNKTWAPISNWRRRARAGQGDKYLRALQETVKSQLIFQPANPELVFIPPIFKSPPTLPKSLAEAAETPEFIDVPFGALFDGASRIVITGSIGSGRTTALIMAIWESAKRAEEDQPFDRIPIWIDLSNIAALPESEKASPLDRFLQLSTLTLPHVSPKWLQQQLRKTPSVILIDNWDILPQDDRGFVAAWIAEVAEDLPNSHWIVTSGTKGYGLLTEIGFVPVKLHTDWTNAKFIKLLQGWSELLSTEIIEYDEEVVKGLVWASRTDAAPLEIVLRTILYLKTSQFPIKPVDILDFHMELALPTPDLGDEMEEVSNQARMIAVNILTQVAMYRRLQNRWVTRQQFGEIIKENLPAKEERHKKLEGTIRKLLSNTRLLVEDKKQMTIPHYIWVDFLTAWYLTQEESGSDYIRSHLDDPNWSLLCEFYVGLVEDSESLVDTLLGRIVINRDPINMLRASRWAIIAPETCQWRGEVSKSLAKNFMNGVDQEIRLLYGKYLGLVAGESARAFFIKMLTSSELDVRAASLRGLGWNGSPKVMAILSAALNDSSIEIRRSAILGLRDLGTPGATTLLEGYLENADEELAPVVAQSLAVMPDGPKVLQDAIQHPDLLTRRAAVLGLGEIGEPWAQELLDEIIRTDPEWLVRSAAETAVSSQLEEKDKEKVIQPHPQIDEVDWLIRWAARQGTGLGVGEAALAMLMRAVQQGDANTKVLGILTLNQLGRQEHLSALEPLLHDPDELVKAQASEVIKNITQRYQVYEGS